MDSSEEDQVKKRIRKLETKPKHFGKPLKSSQPLWVLKVGRSDWRVIYKIKKEEKRILIIAVGHRRNIYNKFP